MSPDTEVFTIKGHRILEYLEKEPYVVDDLIAKAMVAERNDGNHTPEEELKKRIMDIILSFIDDGKIELEEDRKLHLKTEKDIIPLLDEKKKLKIHPALDYSDNAYVGVNIPCKDSEEEKDYLCLVTDSKEVIPVTKEMLKARNLKITNYPAETEPRWSLQSISEFLKGKEAGVEIFNKVKEQYEKYIDFPEKEAYDFFSLWIIGSYLHPLFQSYPYVYIGGMKESGKTKVLFLSHCLAFNSIFSGNMSASSLFRLIQDNRCALLIDETEKLSNPERAMEFRAILLNGYKSGSKIYRVEANRAKQFKVIPFEPYSPKMLANIRGLEDVLESRCISFVLKRTLNKEIGDREINEKDSVWQQIRDSLYIFLMKNWKDIRNIYFELVNETSLNNRLWELWKPILSIAKFIDADLYEEMKILAQKKAEEQRTESITETGEYILIETLVQMISCDNYYRIKDIRERMLEQFDSEQKWLTNEWIGRALKRLGFAEKRRVGSGIEIRLTVKNVMDIAERLLIRPAQPSEHAQLTLEGSVGSEGNVEANGEANE